MDQLAYPEEVRNIALDFDATASTNIPFWQMFCGLAHDKGYRVYVVTARHPNRLNIIKAAFEGHVEGIIATSHMAKMHYCQQIGLRIDIWIDDSPWNVYCNINGSVPETEHLSLLNPQFGENIANLIFPRNHPLTIRGYGFYYTDCHYEVPLIRKSFHRTKAGAYRAMRKFLLETWDRHWRGYVNERKKWSSALGENSQKRQGTWYGPFEFSKYTVMPCTFELNE